MNISLFNKKLNKISLLADSLDTDEQMSMLERDLLLNYIRDLYEIVLESDANLHSKSTNIHETHAPKPKIVEEIAPKKEEIIRQSEIVEPPKIEAQPKIVVEEQPKQVIVEAIAIAPKQVEEVVVVSSNPIHTIAPKDQESINELFANEKITDLSDKLALTPIKDLTKSMGINEKIFTQQELFGNDSGKFNEVLTLLNNCQTFDDAKQYLISSVIYKYDWLSEGKIKKASTFVKLVKRKFV